MSGKVLNVNEEAVRYINTESAENNEQTLEIIISPKTEEKQYSEKKEQKLCLYPVPILIILVTVYMTIATIHLSKTAEIKPCIPLKEIKKVVLTFEKTSFNYCSDGKSCHTLVNVIERSNDGLEYNFVIGQRGELYIGAGFGCQPNHEDNTLYVKFLRSQELELHQNIEAQCSRLGEILDHGRACDKLSQDFKIQDEIEICKDFKMDKMRLYHVHDPDDYVRFVLRDFGWTTCGNFSSTKNLKKDRITTLESSSNSLCLHLHRVNKVELDVEEYTPFTCINDSSCNQEYGQHHNVTEYNFVIFEDGSIYVGLGFNCKIDHDSSRTLKIKILSDKTYKSALWIRYLQILEEGIACGQMEENFFVTVHCNIADYEPDEEYFAECVYHFNFYYNYYSVKQELEEIYLNSFETNFTFSSVDGRQIIDKFVDGGLKYKLCNRYKVVNTSNDRVITTLNPSYCSLFNKVSGVQVDIEEIDYERGEYPCSDNENCRSFADVVEQKHNGMKYNFVIGLRGELYIGAGFKCLPTFVDRPNTLYVKILISKDSIRVEEPGNRWKITLPDDENLAVCSRLYEIIEQGFECGKIVLPHVIQTSVYKNEHCKNECPTEICLEDTNDLPRLIALANQFRSHFLYFPHYKPRTLIPANFKWKFCEDKMQV